MSEFPVVRKMYVVIILVLAGVALIGVGVVLGLGASTSSQAKPTRQCGKADWVSVYVNTDDEMSQVQAKIRAEGQVQSVTGLTKQQTYEQYQRMFADQPELLKLTRPDSLPAEVLVVPAPGVTAGDLADRLRKEFPEAKQVEKYDCNTPSATPTP